MTDIDLRLGDWRDVLKDVECDALITDPPYSERTHSGHNEGAVNANRASESDDRLLRADASESTKKNHRRQLSYDPWSAHDVDAFVRYWAPRTRGWMVAFTDHVLAPAWEAAYQKTGRYVFAPLQFVHMGSRVRITGDGPALWSTTIVVARPKTLKYSRWGSLAGGYVLPSGENERANQRGGDRGVVGGKPLWIMRSLVRDYSRPGDLIVDPCAGGATTLIAARTEGRRSIGAELEPKTHALAMKRISKPYTPNLFQDEMRERAKASDNAIQASMFEEQSTAAASK